MESNTKRREFLKDQIYEEVRQDILTFRYMPDEKLSEYSLAKRFRVSRSPIRAVLQKLESENLVIIDPQRGTFVTRLDYNYIQDIMYLRWCVETTLMSQVALEKPAELLRELHTCVDRQRQLFCGKIELEEFMALDNQFHKTIYFGNHHEDLWSLVTQVNANYQRFRQLDLIAEHSYGRIYQDHCNLLHDMETGSIEHMRNLMQQHLKGNLQTSDGIKQEYRKYFTEQ